MGQGVLIWFIGRLRERRMHNQSPSQFILATIGSACIFGLLSITWTPAQATPMSSPDARMELPSRAWARD